MHILTWLLFLVGQLSYILFQVDAIVRAKNNTAVSRIAILKDRWTIFALRGVAGSMLFWIFLGGALPDLLTAFKVESPGWLSALSAVINSQAGPPCAYFAGLGVDSLLGFIPVLKSYIPSEVVAVSQTTQAVVNQQTGAVETVKQKTEVTTAPASDK